MGIEEAVRWLRRKKAVALYAPENLVVFLKEGFWGVLYVKPRRSSPIESKDKQLIKKMDEWSWARIVYEENWPQIKQELEEWLR